MLQLDLNLAGIVGGGAGNGDAESTRGFRGRAQCFDGRLARVRRHGMGRADLTGGDVVLHARARPVGLRRRSRRARLFLGCLRENVCERVCAARLAVRDQTVVDDVGHDTRRVFLVQNC